ncbi:unnamed protein product [Blepharisma stoltei]|uniref:Serine aminopeptidase S33 domain-containing protein n=1 Tax=Blepharisma stoltei TaxID=1481888 RepID=A0AAU9JFB4_9CILI|nr:unnamed protein product [Blepharisma stoltei]
MSFLKKGYQDLWKAIIRPPRDVYETKELGPTEFCIGERSFKRTDISLQNRRGLRLECSHFEPVAEERVCAQLPCVIYLHGNSSSRLEALASVPVLLPANITLFCLDTSGSGLSEGEYISLGWYERDDVDYVVEYLRNCGTVSCIGLWGRSMGAVTALLHADRDLSIAGMVLDSPFSNLKVLTKELAAIYAKNIPGIVLSAAKSMIRKTIRKKANFDSNELDPLKHVDKCFIPALFVAGEDDTFVNPKHSQILYDKYAGDKNIIIVEGDHNSDRPQFMLDSVAIFFYNTLQCQFLPQLEIVPRSAKKRKKFSRNARVFEKAREFQDNLVSEEELLRQAIEESLKVSDVKNEDPVENSYEFL